jgi:hypothetical protein
MNPNQYGYKGNWKRLLAYVLDISLKAVDDWGPCPEFPNCPDKYKRILEMTDALIVAEQTIKKYGLTEQQLREIQ